MEPDLTKWKELVRERKATCYIKPTRFKHDSGFRTFEVGYCTIGLKGKIGEKIVLYNGSDHVHTDFMGLMDATRQVPINMDLTMDGYIRIWGNEKTSVVWGDTPLSSATLEVLM